MNKVLKNAIALFTVAILCASGCSLGTKDGPAVDKNKTQIYVSVYDGGNGTEWIEKIAENWNGDSSYKDKYQIIINPLKQGMTEILTNINLGSQSATSPSIYYSGQSDYQSVIYKDKLENLEDLLELELDGVGNGTLGDKLGPDDRYLNEWKAASSKFGEGMYILPQSDNFGLMVFDYDYFIEQEFLKYVSADDAAAKAELTNQGVSYTKTGTRLTVTGEYTGSYKYYSYEEGDEILTAGKDGVYGSYDDGQPETVSEFRTLINKIKNSYNKSKPFIWTSEYSDYVDMVANSAMCQYLGVEETNTYYDFEGQITVDGVKKNITVDNGYEVYGNDGFKVAVDFLDEFFNSDANVYGDSRNGSISHKDAQGSFILAYEQKNENLEFGNILVEGEWFENEASAVFKEQEKKGRGKGAREYRVLLLPNFEGQKGIDGEGNGSVVSVLNNGAIAVPKQSDANKLAAIKDFICRTLTNESLQLYTTTCGAMMAYRYDLTESQYEKLTPFNKNCYQIHKDSENVYMSRFRFLNTTNFLAISSSAFESISFPVRYNGAAVPTLIRGLKAAQSNADVVAGRKTVTEVIVQGAKDYFAINGHTVWDGIVQAARNNGFYSVSD